MYKGLSLAPITTVLEIWQPMFKKVLAFPTFLVTTLPVTKA
jgi:hypothetical protein